MKSKEILIRRDIPVKKMMITPIISTIPEEENEFRLLVDIAVGEVISNLKKYNDGSPVSVHWTGNGKRLTVWIQSEFQRIHYLRLMASLEESKGRKRKGQKCPFLQDEHGIGHDMLVNIACKSGYDAEGRLTALFRSDRLPDPKSLQLVAL